MSGGVRGAASEAYAAVRDARAAWMLLPDEARHSGPGLALRDALRVAGDRLARSVLAAAPDDGMTDEERRERADEAARECDFRI